MSTIGSFRVSPSITVISFPKEVAVLSSEIFCASNTSFVLHSLSAVATTSAPITFKTTIYELLVIHPQTKLRVAY